MTLRAVVADDEPLGRRGIVARLAASGRAEVVAECANGRQAIEAVRRLGPDVLFLDVRMPGCDGFGVLEALPSGRRPHVVFVTAFGGHAARAFRVRALDYLVKPIDDDAFADALSRAESAVAAGQAADGAFPVRDRGRVTFVPLADIDWIGAEGDYLRIHSGGRDWLARGTLASAQRELPERRFARIHRSTIVNKDRIREIRWSDSGDAEVVLTNDRGLRASRTYREQLVRLAKRT